MPTDIMMGDMTLWRRFVLSPPAELMGVGAEMNSACPLLTVLKLDGGSMWIHPTVLCTSGNVWKFL